MNKIFTAILSVFVLVLLISPASNAAAAKMTLVKAKVQSYKGQGYVQVSGGNQKATTKINKLLKTHAVKAAEENTKLKKQQNHYYRNTKAETKFNKNQLLSIVYKDYYYKGGVHGYETVTTYNLDLVTGDQIYLQDLAQTNRQKFNLFDGIETGLKSKKDVFPEKIRTFPLSRNSSFYYYNDGIVMVFEPYEVGPYASGFIEVKVSHKKINSQSNKPFLDLNKDTVTALKEGKLPGFNNVVLGQTQKQTMQALKSKGTIDSYYESGGLFWVFEGIDYASFNFSEDNKDLLRSVYLSSKTLPMKTFKDIEKILGKGKIGESSNYMDEVILYYSFGDIHLEFTSDALANTIDGIRISKR